MAAAFRPVNPSLSKEAISEDGMSPSTTSPHRPSTAPHSQYPHPSDDSTTLAGQRPLPTSPFPQVRSGPELVENDARRDSLQRLKKSPEVTLVDVEMDDSDGEGDGDGETGTVDENPGSDDESVNADESRSGKKKKSQRFYCTEYPPCNLSFTRSEHLARHIRKHTGERPFQCHCSRRFSRLDNLRQHAQTVHVNEDIPLDSLAATGSRFQRQVRNDRVRQAGNRARASTGGSAGGPARGHSKSLSTPSLSSIANLAASAASAYNPQMDPRQRPMPIVMAADPRSRHSFEAGPGNKPENPFAFRPQSPIDYTPGSGPFPPNPQASPSWRPDMGSPSPHSRSQSMYSMGARPASRRLSVPTGPNPFLYPQPPQAGRPSFGPSSMNGNSAAPYAPMGNGQVSSPYMTNVEWDARRDSSSTAGEEAWRRRTWHSDGQGINGSTHPSNNPALRPSHPLPIADPSVSSSNLRLPGIESFDPILRRPATPPRQQLPPLAVDPQLGQLDERRNLNMYDVSLQRGLNRLDIGRQTPPRDVVWTSDGSRASQAQAERTPIINPPTVRFEEQPRQSRQMLSPGAPNRSFHQYTMSAPNLAPSRENRRHGSYHGSVAGQNENGQQYQQEARGPHLDKMVHPNFTGFAGFPARDQSSQAQQQERAGGADPLRRLEALVAVATSEGSTATAY